MLYSFPLFSHRYPLFVLGVNFEAMWELPDTLIQHDHITSNDIWKLLQIYGVEAARCSIVSEVQGVFGVYGIDVNARHLRYRMTLWASDVLFCFVMLWHIR